MKKFLAMFMALAMMLSLAACGGSSSTTEESTSTETSAAVETEATEESEAAEETEATEESEAAEADGEVADSITLWTYPIGNWGDESTVNELIAAFTEETGISVTVEYLDYTNGDDKVNTAITAGNAPDVIMEGPERLVANWGAQGYMVDLSDIMDETDQEEIYESVLSACVSEDGSIYEYPLVMTAHCMAINYDAFVAAGADQYVDLETHTWTTEDFQNAVAALYDYYGSTVGAVYCAGQGGDQGTRALVNNLFGGTFTNDEHTAYTWDDAENIEALELLYNMEGIDFDASIVGGDEIALFYQGTLKMAFCWNIAQQLDPNGAGTGSGLTISGETIEFMSFPSETGESELCGGIWGFGIFDNGDDAKIAAAKLFIQYMCDSENTVSAIQAANYFAVRDTVEDGSVDISDIWADNEIMQEYQVLMQYLGDYYQVTTGWAQARTSWWTMLQEIGAGGDVTEMVMQYMAEANEAAG
ncbi:MAG: extracellular solute-binding protein [Oscillospiraceae bacterium]|nr:extracellular solute-binding protein [Oscillospiraceae bacterium]